MNLLIGIAAVLAVLYLLGFIEGFIHGLFGDKWAGEWSELVYIGLVAYAVLNFLEYMQWVHFS